MPFRLNFKHEIGYAEVVSVIALVLSAAAVWYGRAQTNSAFAEVSLETPRQFMSVIESQTSPSARSIIVVVPMVVTNHGGRAVALLKLEHGGPPLLLEAQYVNGHVSLKENRTLVPEVAFMELLPNSADELLRQAMKATFSRLESPHFLNRSIEPGKSELLVLVFRLKTKDGLLVFNPCILLSINAVFSNGKTFPLQAAFGSE